MNKYIVIVVLVLFVNNLMAQSLGINTVTPQNDLHVNGNLQVTKEINLGGSDVIKGNPGEDGQFLVSQGPNKAPEWKSIHIPTVPGSYALAKSFVLVDNNAIRVNYGIKVNKRIYNLDESINYNDPADPNAKWQVFSKLTSKVTINKNRSFVNLSLQCMSDKNSSDSNVSFAIGFFIDKKLKAVRPLRYAADYDVLTVLTTIKNLPVGTYDLQVALMHRDRDKDESYQVANPMFPVLLSPFMTQATLQVDILEAID